MQLLHYTPVSTAEKEVLLWRSIVDIFEDGELPRNSPRMSFKQRTIALQKRLSEQDAKELGRVITTMDTDPQTIVSTTEFADLFVQQARDISQQVLWHQKESARLRDLLTQSLDNLRKAEAAQNIRASKASLHQEEEENVLTVHVAQLTASTLASNTESAMDHNEGDTPQALEGNQYAYYIQLECQQQKISTSPLRFKEACPDLHWNALYSFTIDSEAQKDLTVSLKRSTDLTRKLDDPAEAVFQISLDMLSDQRKRDIDTPLSGLTLNGKLLLTCQWIYCKKRLFTDLASEFSRQLESEKRQLKAANRRLSALYRAFGLESRANEILNIILQFLRPDLISWMVENVVHQLRFSSVQRALEVGTLAFLILSCAKSYARCSFLDMSIGAFAFWCNLDYMSRWDSKRYSCVLAALIISLLLDIVWMRFFFESTTTVNGIMRTTAGMRSLTKIFTLFSFVCKMFLAPVLWKCRWDGTTGT